MKSFRDPFEWGVKITNIKKSSGAKEIEDFFFFYSNKNVALTGLVWKVKLPIICVNVLNIFSTRNRNCNQQVEIYTIR